MGEPLTNQKLNDMWRAGYCRETVAFASTTTNSSTDARKRLAYMEDHIKECSDCYLANRMKALEAQTAAAMGPATLELFTKGGDITHLPNFHQYFDPILLEAKRTESLWSLPSVQEWMARSAQRGSYTPEGENDSKTN